MFFFKTEKPVFIENQHLNDQIETLRTKLKKTESVRIKTLIYSNNYGPTIFQIFQISSKNDSKQTKL